LLVGLDEQGADKEHGIQFSVQVAKGATTASNRMIGDIIECGLDALECALEAKVVFKQAAGDLELPRLRPITPSPD